MKFARTYDDNYINLDMIEAFYVESAVTGTRNYVKVRMKSGVVYAMNVLDTKAKAEEFIESMVGKVTDGSYDGVRSVKLKSDMMAPPPPEPASEQPKADPKRKK